MEISTIDIESIRTWINAFGSEITVILQIVLDVFEILIGIIAAITPIIAFKRRPISSTNESGPYFNSSELLSPPLARPAYSDRMAYILSEMASLAYFQFEGDSGLIEDAIDIALSKNLSKKTDVRKFLEEYTTELMSGERRLGRESMKKILENSGFMLLDIINIGETQGFVCKRTVKNESPYLVLAFRGTEKKVSDWLTDVKCIPTINEKSRVHTGFLEALTKYKDFEGNSVENKIRIILEQSEARDESNELLPLFITGHSLGGALALLATKLVASDVNGACYTFGAPRVANYEYFRSVKTPVFRIVNSSDIVPRVPPGAVMFVFIHAIKVMAWLTSFVPMVASLFNKLEEVFDKLNGYRHYGDLRYLSDVAGQQFNTVRLLVNPPAIDRLIWMWRHLAKSLFFPLRSHGMSIYRKKLTHIAKERNC